MVGRRCTLEHHPVDDALVAADGELDGLAPGPGSHAESVQDLVGHLRGHGIVLATADEVAQPGTEGLPAVQFEYGPVGGC
jgi:hypothetical protein